MSVHDLSKPSKPLPPQTCDLPAFPLCLKTRELPSELHPGPGGYENENEPGVSRLEYFTAAAMQGLCANAWLLSTLAERNKKTGELAPIALSIAVTTLAELEKDKERAK